MKMNRRTFLGGALAAIACCPRTGGGAPAADTDLVPDPNGILDLPEGFRYRILSRAGHIMDDGFLVPGRPDGMAAFRREDGKVALIRNHELNPAQQQLSSGGENIARVLELGSRLYDRGGGKTPGCGGTTTLLLNPDTGEIELSFLSLAGTELNCAGGPTPWNSWLSCEESVSRTGHGKCWMVNETWTCEAGYAFVARGTDTMAEVTRERDHGFVFEVPAEADAPVAPVALTAMGRFHHEAAAVDPDSGIVYMTEDRVDGLLYRFLPATPGSLAEGGTLQALAIRGEPSRDTANTRGMARFPQGLWRPVEWITVDNVEAPEDDLRLRGYEAGAARFVRGEGAWFANGEMTFTCTWGGRRNLGQIFRYRPSPFEGRAGESGEPGRLMLFIEAQRDSVMHHCDNLTVSPWGDLIVAEDAPDNCRLLRVTPAGRIYPLALHRSTDSELAGVCFSPDGEELFVNVQEPGLTLGITGPWPLPPS